MQANMCDLFQTLTKGSAGIGSSTQLSGKKEEIANEDSGLFLSFFQAISSDSEDSGKEGFGMANSDEPSEFKAESILPKGKVCVKEEEQPEIIVSMFPAEAESRNMILSESSLTNQEITAVESDLPDESVNTAKDFEKTDVQPQSFNMDSDNEPEDRIIAQKTDIDFEIEAKIDDKESNLNSRIDIESKPEHNGKHNIDIGVKDKQEAPPLRSESRSSFEDKDYGAGLKRDVKDFSIKNAETPWQENREDNTAKAGSEFSGDGEARLEVSNGSNNGNADTHAILPSQFKEEIYTHTQQRAANTGGAELSQETKGRVINQVVEHVSFFKAGKLDAVRIQLKPESLGQLKLEILTENKQVTLKIVTELHAVRSIIEENLGQLKADLRDSGLEISRCEVSVDSEAHKGHGHAHSFARFFMPDVFKKSEGNSPKSADDDDDSDTERIPDEHKTPIITEGGVNCFV